jgi:aquaporin rerated protein, other eukaryote
MSRTGLFNPAVILAMALIGSISWLRALLNVISELAAAIAAAAVVSGLFPGPLSVATSLETETSQVQGLCECRPYLTYLAKLTDV